MGTSCIPAMLMRRVLSLCMTCDASIPTEAGRLMAGGRRYIFFINNVAKRYISLYFNAKYRGHG